MYVHMIRHKKTGLYSTGSSHPRFAKVGKIWTSSQSFNGHLAAFDNTHLMQVYKDCEFVSFELTESTTSDIEEQVRKNDRREKLAKEHGVALADFIQQLDKKDKISEFRWVVKAEGSKYTGGPEACKDAIALNKIKRSKYLFSKMIYAFSDKQDAMVFRLSLGMDSVTFDGVTFKDWQVE